MDVVSLGSKLQRVCVVASSLVPQSDHRIDS
jgi:hypothetical protein